MSSKDSSVFYTNVFRQGKYMKIRIADMDGGRRNLEHIFKPELYVEAHDETSNIRGLHGECLEPIQFKNIYECDKWLDENRDTPDFNIYGQTDHTFACIAHKWQNKIKFNPDVIRCANIDIEVISGYRDADDNIVDGPFPEPTIEEGTFKTKAASKRYFDHANEFFKWFSNEWPRSRTPAMIDMNAVFPIPLIQLSDRQNGKKLVWALPEQRNRGVFKYDPNDPEIGGQDVEYYEFETEQELLAAYVTYWQQRGFDAWTGWNIEGFDSPYLVERIRKVLGEEWVKVLSPWGVIKKNKVKAKWGDFTSYSFAGCEMLDYRELYQKHTYTTREKYSLDHIAYCELGERKLDYEEAKSLMKLYFMDWVKYVRYGIKDIMLVDRIDDKLKLLNLTYTLAYLTKSNYSDTLGTVRPWNALVYSFLHNKGMRPKVQKVVDEVPSFPGGYVKDVKAGFYKWVLSVDLNSLYPHIIQQYNMGPETIVSNDLRRDIIFEMCEELRAAIKKNTADFKLRRALSTLLEKLSDTKGDGLDDIVDELCTLGKWEFKCLKEHNVSMAPNVTFFHNDRMSVFSEIMRMIYSGRKVEKSDGLKAGQREIWCKELLVGNYDTAKAKHNRFFDQEYHQKITSMDHDRLKSEKALQAGIEAMQDVLQMGYKILMNSGYGAISNKWFRDYFDLRIATAITAAGRLINKWNIRYVNDLLNEKLGTSGFDYAFYGDTDSNYITMDNLVVQQGWDKLDTDSIVDKLDDYYKSDMHEPIQQFAQDMADTCNAYEQRMFWEREVIAQAAVWQAPKLYIMAVNNSEGQAFAEPKIKFMGVAAKKSSTPEWCREKLKACYKTILTGTEECLQGQVKEIKEEYFGKTVEQIAGASSVSDIDKWADSDGNPIKGTPYASKASLIHNKYMEKTGVEGIPKIKSGDKIMLVNLKMPNPMNYNYMAFGDFLPPEFEMNNYIDYQATFEKQFLNHLQLTLNPVGWHWKKRVNLFALGGAEKKQAIKGKVKKAKLAVKEKKARKLW
ncbi:putative DNA-directed DNA polymerase [Vibrio phage 144E46.1]|nr:putative DNA-directed DNA polymerase [Vibrio phage 144E46.1]